MDNFNYKKVADITALSASLTNFKYKNHYHKEYAIGVTLRGIQHYHLDGHLQLSYPNGVMFFNPEQAHDGMAHDENGLDYVMLYIDPQSLLDVTEKKEMIYFQKPIVYNHILKSSVLNLAHAILSGKDESLCSTLLLSLTDNLIQTNVSANLLKDNMLIKKAKEMLRSDLGNVLKLDDISKQLNLSKFQFIRMFKAQTGITPYQYSLNHRLEQARKLMEKSKDLYSAVAHYGFVDLTHLNKHFKCVYGTTAHEYISYFN